MPRESLMAWATAFRGAYDPEFQALLRSYIAPGSIVLDIGASLGLWTVPLARAAAIRDSALWAFEPLPDNQQWLRRNVAVNELTNVTIEACALGAEPGEAFMEGEPGGGNAAIAAHGVRVPVRTLDEFSFPARVSAIKIDVEGYELQVLEGASCLLARDRPVILGEFSREWLRRRGQGLDGFLEDMRGRDYVVYEVELHRENRWMAASSTRLHEYGRGTVAEELLLVPEEIGRGMSTSLP